MRRRKLVAVSVGLVAGLVIRKPVTTAEGGWCL
jgi:hypothetical protein